jgi:DnaK suppressor protein
MSQELKVRYSDEELQEFKAIIENKLVTAHEELERTTQQIADLNENGFNQQGGDWYDDSTAHTDLELLQRMSARQQRHIQDLRNALLRIQNKTYGICTITGQLIDKNRLRLVPHATKSVDGKAIANSGREVAVEAGTDQFPPPTEESERRPGKPIGDKVRLPNAKRAKAEGEDWENNADQLDEPGYANGRKYEQDDDE